MDWLWKFKGKLLIISTKYHEGVHYAEIPSHFIPIITHLEQLHDQGYVHGDIRAYNMVLQYNTSENSAIGTSTGSNSDNDTTINSTTNDSCEGWLIDFDYGGENGKVAYPKGYKKELLDGRRPGAQGEKITIIDDWKSLIGLIFHTHVFKKRQGAELTIAQKVSILEKKEALQDCSDMEVQQLVFLLREYIRLTSDDYVVTLHENYHSNLIKCGLLPTSTVLQAATGSPPNGK